jgi:putative sterol carrier protein
MSAGSDDPDVFYLERVPAQFNRTLAEQVTLAKGGDEAAGRLLKGMQSVNATIQVEVDGGETYHLNVDGGEMRAASENAQAPFMIIRHDLTSFAALEQESGDSILSFLGGIAGMADEMKLTSQRIQNLQGLDGSLLFELTGARAFTILAHFGPSQISEEPNCKIAVDGDSYDQLRSGALGPQDAFLGGQIKVEGDMAMGMQVALAALSPE